MAEPELVLVSSLLALAEACVEIGLLERFEAVLGGGLRALAEAKAQHRDTALAEAVPSVVLSHTRRRICRSHRVGGRRTCNTLSKQAPECP